MNNFKFYSNYYDLLYTDKDYNLEVDFITSLLKEHALGAKTILDLGCGTGAHAYLFCQKGYTVHGIDLSQTMLDIAIQNHGKIAPQFQNHLSFSIGNAQDCRVGREFDVVLSLFHVVSYQTTNTELRSVIANAALHLKSGGVFIFDFWYGPAVLSERPSIRVKRIQSDKINLTRIAEPEMDSLNSCVEVKYHIIIQDNSSKIMEEIKETHRMRYLFLTEIDMLANLEGLTVEKTCELLSGREPSFDTWGVCAVLRKT